RGRCGLSGHWQQSRHGRPGRAATGCDSMKTIDFLGTPLLITDYDGLAADCLRWAREPRCRALDFANTQIVTLRRHDPAFRELTETYDFFPPDGMPLVWCLN